MWNEWPLTSHKCETLGLEPQEGSISLCSRCQQARGYRFLHTLTGSQNTGLQLTQTQPWIYTTLRLSPGLPPPMSCARACMWLSTPVWGHLAESLSLFPLLHGCCSWICLVRLIKQDLLICWVILLALGHTLKKNKFEPDQFNIIDHFWFVICLRKCLVIRPVFLCFLNGVRISGYFPTYFPHSVTCMLIFVISLMSYFC